jgi:nucleoside 2-deoxyribosyltransferase
MKLYFAGPLFTTPERQWNAEVTAALRAAGHEIFLPQEQEPGKDGPGIFATDVGGIDWADGLVAIMDGPDPDSGTAWEVGYAYRKKPIVLVRTDSRAMQGNAGEYNPMLTQAATIRLDLPAASTTEVVGSDTWSCVIRSAAPARRSAAGRARACGRTSGRRPGR